MNQYPDTGRVLVTGATGAIGGAAVRLLVAAGVEVRALHRRPDQAEALARLGATPVQGSLGDQGEMTRALADVSRALLVVPPTPQQDAYDAQFVRLAQHCALTHLVRVSASDSNVNSPVPWARAHARGDHRLAATDLQWTVLRPSAFVQNLLAQAPTLRRGLLPHAAGSAALAWVDARDVAAVATQVILDGPAQHLRATYFLTGPEALSYSDIATRLSRVLDRRVRAVSLPKNPYIALLRAARVDAFTARGLGAQFADVVRHHADLDVTGEVQRLTGTAPRTLTAWIHENSDKL